MRIGYDPDFLGLRVPLPGSAVATTTLDYPHFSVAFRPDRRLAAVSGVNIHGGLLRDIERNATSGYSTRGYRPSTGSTPLTTPTTSMARSAGGR